MERAVEGGREGGREGKKEGERLLSDVQDTEYAIG